MKEKDENIFFSEKMLKKSCSYESKELKDIGLKHMQWPMQVKEMLYSY